MLSGLTTAESISRMRLDALTGKRNKPRVFGDNGFNRPLFGNINANRYATGGTNPVFSKNPADLYPDLFGVGV